MRILLKRNHRLFNFEHEFGATLAFSPTLLVDAGFLDKQSIGAVDCTAFTVDKVKSGDTGKRYDHTWLWNQMIRLGKVAQFGATPQDAFSTAVKGQKVLDKEEYDDSVAYFQTEIGKYDFFTNVKSAIQTQFNKGFKRPVGVGTYWFDEWTPTAPNGIMPEGKRKVSPHEWVVCGWDEEHPECFKIDAHLGYYTYMPRDEFNKAMNATYGSVALTLAETEEERIEFLKEVNYSRIQAIIDMVYNALKIIQAKINLLKPPITPPVAPIEPVVTSEKVKPKRDLLTEFCLSIRDFEGQPGDLNYRNHNPGNVRGTDGKFLVFKTDEEGFAYLKDYVRRACTGKHPSYLPDMTIVQFFRIYAPISDKNNPDAYAQWVCNRMKILPSTKIKELV